MLKKHPRFFEILQVGTDAVAVALAFSMAYTLRFSFPLNLPYASVSDPRETIWVGCFAVSTWVLFAYLGRLYVSHRSRSLAYEFFEVFRTSLYSFFAVVTLTYFIRDVRYSRLVIGFWLVFSFVGVSFFRAILRLALRRIRSRGYNLRHVLVVGTGALAAQTIQLISRRPELGLRVRGVIREPSSPRRRAQDEITDLKAVEVMGAPVIGDFNQLSAIAAESGIDQVLVALPIEKLGVVPELMNSMSLLTIDVRLIPDIYQHATLCGSIEDFGGMPVINLQGSPQAGWNRAMKRLFDFCLTATGLIVAGPIVAAIAVLIKLTSRGPVFYSQVRVGFDGRPFTMYKFRTMVVDAESNGAQMAVSGDPRCTRLGSFLRRTSMDELPQLWNVLRGEMSLVGPRPERPCFVEDLKQEIPRYALRHKMKAGMTGWAQVHGMRGNTCIQKRVELDLYYIENWSVGLDIKILMKTIFGGFLSPNAY